MLSPDLKGPELATELLERSGELSLLGATLDAVAASGRGRLLLVRGEAGTGKTALVRQFCAGRPSTRVLWGGCDALFTPRPLGPFLDIARVTGGDLALVAERGAQPYEVAEVLLREFADPPASVVIVEDVHWADEATLDVLRIITRRIEGLRALIVLTFRDDGLDRRHPLRTLLGELSGSRVTTRIDVGPLSLAAVASLAAPYGVDAGELHRTTSGNPFFVTEVLATSGAQIPDTVRDAVLARSARLGGDAAKVLEAVAIVRPHAELWLLEALVPDSADGREECVAAGMLRAGPERVFFRHELARRAIEESIPAFTRIALHRRALAALAGRSDLAPDWARLAHHAEAAGDADAVLHYATAAAEHAASFGAHGESADHYATVLKCGTPLPAAEHAALLERYAQECYVTDRNPDAIAALRGALERYHEIDDPRAEGSVLSTMSNFLWCPGRVAEAEHAGRQSVALLERLEPGRELGLAYVNLSFLARSALDIEETVAWGIRGLESGTRLGDLGIQLAATASLAQADGIAGQTDARARLERVLDLAHEHGLVDTAGWTAVLIAQLLMFHHSYADANLAITRALTYCGDHGLELYRHYGLAFRARAELDQGRWAEADESAGQVLRARRASTTPTIIGLTVVGRLHARRGERDAWSLLEEARAIAEPTGELPRIGPVAAARAETAWLEGRHAAIKPATDAAFELSLRRNDSWLRGELALWRRRAGVREEIPPGIAEPYVLQMAGDWERAAQLWTQIGRPYDAALALADADKEEPLRLALADLQKMSARPATAIVARKLRDLGVQGVPRGPRTVNRANPAGLSRRELEVLELVAVGLRNGQIAQRLFLSAKTVDHHIGSILRKLGVSSRTEAASVAGDLGILR
jgi:DNA-binding CsgD family transcriptional regulator